MMGAEIISQYVQSERVSLGKNSLHVLSRGEGRPLVYLHGVGDTGAFLPVLDDLSQRYRVIRPDHPGFLLSDDFPTANIRDIAQMHKELLDRLDVRQFTLVGCSMGGWVAAELAMLVPERITELVLIGPVGMVGDRSAPDIFSMATDELLNATVSDVQMRAGARSAKPDANARLLKARNMAELRRVTPPEMSDPSLIERLSCSGLGTASIPTTIIWGAEDGVMPPNYAADWKTALPHSQLHILEAAGHLPHVEAKARFLAAAGLLGEDVQAGPWS
ncbi:alpha/beta fold hydrolase [Pseudarthrobacter sulfonivorans]|uniref:alpha/beta fold hydrolase n=1 Tax=Pseudarthrobacter sulfonivorans TaxID=121292 RepID=UPI0027885453|nr:alpha/beta hydrolase [Pseudarthrobacter sulfonivorans]MDQ0000746.1 pimeloyl-ACP methyl ester carboxylesterase [Pseudarthrobacter sulfonivorans]